MSSANRKNNRQKQAQQKVTNQQAHSHQVPSECVRFNKNMPCEMHPCPYRHQCLLCGGHHSAIECHANALATTSSRAQPELPPPYIASAKTCSTATAETSDSLPFPVGVCKGFNNANGCSSDNCKKDHVCRYCSRDNHNAVTCRRKPNPSLDMTQQISRGLGIRAAHTASVNSSTSTAESSGPRPFLQGVCKGFNNANGCSSDTCKKDHVCGYCSRDNHNALKCQKQPSSTKQKVVLIQSGSVQVVRVPDFIEGTCFEFNRGTRCKKSPCPYKHLCGICGQLHNALQHP